MRIILKYPIGFDAPTVLEVNQNAKLALVALQRGAPTLWFLVDAAEPKEQRTFFIVATGQPIHARPDAIRHLGSVITKDDNFVWHVFELVKT